ncbi:MAG TPA: glycerol-3-phosphate 1-O-acyltransferase [Hellea balneolensis]|uniref:Glycerol-3-phosphate acyltransferase n=1 Tax=Hellea balneolensis TaxID=287478 RepID=A0A7C3FZN4_9PROT|nr:glycerol-3-phosphate 1-O-acyltransferase [Hellea balneolensis]
MLNVEILISLVGGYLLGSIPFGLVLAKLAGLGDIRAIGSGNIGATNVLRTGRKDLALLTLLLDAGKAGIAALIFGAFFAHPATLIAGGAALFGHCFPVWLKFKGGKGVATYFGVLFATAWPIALIAAAVWLVSALLTRISSLSALLASIGAPIAAFLLGRTDIAIMSAILSAVILIRHKDNIGRILAGTEPKIGKKKSNQEDTE